MSSSPTRSPFGGVTSAALALVGASLAEGGVAAVHASRGGADIEASVLALVAAMLVMVAGGLIPALSIGWLFDRSARAQPGTRSGLPQLGHPVAAR